MNPCVDPSYADLISFLNADDVDAVAERFALDSSLLDTLASLGVDSIRMLLASLRSVAMADVFLAQGLSLAKVGECWSLGFGLEKVSTVVADRFIERGASFTPHAAAALGLTERLRELLDQNPDAVQAKGGDGARPLHFSRNVEIARLLLDRGADLDSRDDDHDSTPAQWRIGDAPEVTQFLIGRGARPDIFMAAALGDIKLARTLVEEDPACTGFRIGHNKGLFPGIGFQGRGGTIYQWTLGFNQSPQEVAHHRGHRELFDFLMSHTRPREQLLISCMLANREMAEDMSAHSPQLINELDEDDLSLLAKCCWETNLNREAVRLMIDLGFPVDVPEFSHGYRPLHNAAWCGDAELVELLLQHGHPVDQRDPKYNATALGFAIHSSVTARRHPAGRFPEVVRLLLEAGTPFDGAYPTGSAEIDAVIRSHQVTLQ